MSIPAYDWQRDAACRGRDVNLFFPDPKDRLRENHAKAICAGCTVRVECMRDGENEPGIRGGFTAMERGTMTFGPDGLPDGWHLVEGRWAPVSAWTYERGGCRCDGCVNAARARWRNKKGATA